MDIQIVRAAEYRAILEAAALFMPDVVIEKNKDHLRDLRASDCTWIYFCPYSLEIVGANTSLINGSWWNNIPSIFAPIAHATYVQDGCYSLDCTPLNPLQDDDFCITDDLLDYYPNEYSDVTLCNPASDYVSRLQEFRYLLDAQPNFNGSELKNFLDINQENPASKCARVTFCRSNFEIIQTNISTVECCTGTISMSFLEIRHEYTSLLLEGNFVGSQTHEFIEANIEKIFDSDYECNWVTFCSNNFDLYNYSYPIVHCGSEQPMAFNCNTQTVCDGENSSCLINCTGFGSTILSYCGENPITGSAYDICEPPSWFDGLTGGGNEEKYIRKIATNPGSGREFVRFSKSMVQGVWQPEAIVQGDSTLFLDHSIQAERDLIWNTPNLHSVISDMENNGKVFWLVESENDPKYQVKYRDNNDFWNRSLGATGALTIRFVDQVDSLYVLGGEFTGTLTFGDQTIGIAPESSGFIVYLNNKAVLVRQNLLGGIRQGGQVRFAKFGTKVSISAVSADAGMSFDGESSGISNGQIGCSESSPENGHSYSSNLRPSSTQSLEAVAVRGDGNYQTFLFKGTGRIYSGTSTVAKPESDSYTLVTIDKNGDIVWAQSTPSEAIHSDKISMEYGALGTLVVGVTFVGSTVIWGDFTPNNGNTDVALVGFDTLGNKVWHKSFGTAEEETVKGIFSSGGLIYFAGEYSGMESRSLGEVQNLATNISRSNPYISFVYENQSEQSKMVSKERSTDIIGGRFSKVEVSPNPFSRVFSLSVVADFESEAQIKVFHTSGDVVWEKTTALRKGSNQLPINIGENIPSGIYFIQVIAQAAEINEVIKVVRR